ncbi:MAG TPA: Asp-tRNA(Asn)/Glu-tRNA(Gln) amidotransferase subunit GatA [Candidatus Paceibacterota bacterium]|nr:Asp-tRNA(Asn)/Glu-tRNA(Gln) amidotransferase subunit GatA [Candidatus Paceibacterota bacterium]
MIKEIHQKLVNHEVTVSDLVKTYSDNLQKHNGELNAYLSINEGALLEEAIQNAEQILKNNPEELLAGIPIAVKDNILVKGLKATAASKILENYVAVEDATIIGRLKERGVIILGKTNLDEFAMGSSTEHSAFGPTHNPYNLDLVPGGSSGGSAAAVAADLSVAALGSDTGGSIRQPASFCGVVGFKPSYGAVSRYGLLALSSSLDQIGPLAKNVSDCQTIFAAIVGKDPKDATTVSLPPAAPLKDLKSIRIGLPKEYFVEGTDSAIKNQLEKLINQLKAAGTSIEEVSLPLTSLALPCYYIIMPAEASSNLGRYDGLRYANKEGFKDGENLLDYYLRNKGTGFGSESRRRILLGTYVLSAGYYDTYYKKALQVQEAIRRDFDRVFKQVDYLITPTTPTPAFALGAKTDDPISMYLADIFTVSANLAGVPAINLNGGFNQNGLPLGIQLIAGRYQDFSLLNFSEQIESLLQS